MIYNDTTYQTNAKVVVLTLEDPSFPKFQEVSKALTADAIDPINFIEPENHVLANIYKDMFKDEMANQLMGYLVHKQPILLVWDIINAIHRSTSTTILVNVTLLTEEDITFIISNIDNVLTYDLTGGSTKDTAGAIYGVVKEYKDLLNAPVAIEVSYLG